MSYELSFSHGFFQTEHDDNKSAEEYTRQELDRPTTLIRAIRAWREYDADEFEDYVNDYYGGDPDFVSDLDVLDMAIETNRCDNIDSPVSVWIDPEGLYKVQVYDEQH